MNTIMVVYCHTKITNKLNSCSLRNFQQNTKKEQERKTEYKYFGSLSKSTNLVSDQNKAKKSKLYPLAYNIQQIKMKIAVSLR